MEICGLLKTTLLDYPGHIAASVFLGGCNFRCPFCHNKEVVSQTCEPIPEGDFFSFLESRKEVLEGVCVSGGEPTIYPELLDFIRRIKEMGFLIKLDTNGYCPEVLHSLLEEGLVDYIAMDIKGAPEHYAENCGLSSIDLEKILQSVQLLKDCKIPYEFRTTVAKELQSSEDFEQIGQWLSGAGAYYLQSYRDGETLSGKRLTPYPKEELVEIAESLRKYIPNTFLRGVS